MVTSKKTEQLDLFAIRPKRNKIEDKLGTAGQARQCTKCHEIYLSVNEVASRFGVSRAAAWRWVTSIPDFPSPIKLTPGTTRWKLSDLVSFEAKQEQQKSHHSKVKNSGAAK